MEYAVPESSVESTERVENSGDGSGFIAGLYRDENLGGCRARCIKVFIVTEDKKQEQSSCVQKEMV